MIFFSNDTFREFFQLKQVLGFAILPCVLPSLLLLLLFWSLSLHVFNYKATCPPINIAFVVVDDLALWIEIGYVKILQSFIQEV